MLIFFSKLLTRSCTPTYKHNSKYNVSDAWFNTPPPTNGASYIGANCTQYNSFCLLKCLCLSISYSQTSWNPSTKIHYKKTILRQKFPVVWSLFIKRPKWWTNFKVDLSSFNLGKQNTICRVKQTEQQDHRLKAEMNNKDWWIYFLKFF